MRLVEVEEEEMVEVEEEGVVVEDLEVDGLVEGEAMGVEVTVVVEVEETVAEEALTDTLMQMIFAFFNKLCCSTETATSEKHSNGFLTALGNSL